MDQNLTIGLIYVVIAGIFAGSFSLPMKFTSEWNWQQNWLLYSFWAMLFMPITIAFFTVPNITTIYLNTDGLTIARVILLGMLWGVGSICFGLGLELLGVALGMSIMIGLIITIGAIMPIVIYHPEELTSPFAMKIFIASVILTIGVVIIAVAGGLRNKDINNENTKNIAVQGQFKKGIILAILCGILGPFLNFAYISGNSIKELAIDSGSNPVFAGNAVWCLVLVSGFFVNAGYCIYLINKKREWKLFKTKKSWYWIFIAISGITWFFCIMFFGMASDKLGKFGSSIGWASFESLAIITGNLVGLFTGEWKNTERKIIAINIVGIVILILGIYLIVF